MMIVRSDILLTWVMPPIATPPSSFNCQTSTFVEYVSTLEEWERDLLQYVEVPVDPYSFCIELQPSLRAVCDGSVRTNK